MSHPHEQGWSWRLRAADLRAHGDALALTGAGPDLSYRTLLERAQLLADAITAAGIVAGDSVAILSRGRRHDEPVALAAILLSGAVAVPLDPSSPARRLAAMVSGCGCRAVLHDEAAAAVIGEVRTLAGGGLPGIELDDEGRVRSRHGEQAASSDEAVPPEADRATACILHTSGSTGAPKPIAVRWSGLDAFTAWMISITRLRPGERVLRTAELVFDLAWFDHLATWRSGATLCTMARRDLATGRSLAARITELVPTVIYGVPALFTKLLDAMPDSALLDPRIHTICFAGEVFPPRALRELAERAPDARLFNLFGPTETNVCAFHLVDDGQLDGESETPIGLSTPYAWCSLVDEAGGTIMGEGSGELVVTGPTCLDGRVATGDRVERRSDGLFYFRGRLDRMVKIRGFRVEPGDVEAHLASHPAVREAAVIASEDPRLGKILLAFVATGQAEPPPSDAALRAYLRDRVAAYMVPQRVHLLEELPRTTNGKIDYGKLAAAS